MLSSHPSIYLTPILTLVEVSQAMQLEECTASVVTITNERDTLAATAGALRIEVAAEREGKASLNTQLSSLRDQIEEVKAHHHIERTGEEGMQHSMMQELAAKDAALVQAKAETTSELEKGRALEEAMVQLRAELSESLATEGVQATQFMVAQREAQAADEEAKAELKVAQKETRQWQEEHQRRAAELQVATEELQGLQEQLMSSQEEYREQVQAMRAERSKLWAQSKAMKEDHATKNEEYEKRLKHEVVLHKNVACDMKALEARIREQDSRSEMMSATMDIESRKLQAAQQQQQAQERDMEDMDMVLQAQERDMEALQDAVLSTVARCTKAYSHC